MQIISTLISSFPNISKAIIFTYPPCLTHEYKNIIFNGTNGFLSLATILPFENFRRSSLGKIESDTCTFAVSLVVGKVSFSNFSVFSIAGKETRAWWSLIPMETLHLSLLVSAVWENACDSVDVVIKNSCTSIPSLILQENDTQY